jgi:hypothetical protein
MRIRRCQNINLALAKQVAQPHWYAHINNAITPGPQVFVRDCLCQMITFYGQPFTNLSAMVQSIFFNYKAACCTTRLLLNFLLDLHQFRHHGESQTLHFPLVTSIYL